MVAVVAVLPMLGLLARRRQLSCLACRHAISTKASLYLHTNTLPASHPFRHPILHLTSPHLRLTTTQQESHQTTPSAIDNNPIIPRRTVSQPLTPLTIPHATAKHPNRRTAYLFVQTTLQQHPADAPSSDPHRQPPPCSTPPSSSRPPPSRAPSLPRA